MAIQIRRIICKFWIRIWGILLQKFREKRLSYLSTELQFSRGWKIKNKISYLTWPAQSLNVTENACRAIKLKLYIETNVMKMHLSRVGQCSLQDLAVFAY